MARKRDKRSKATRTPGDPAARLSSVGSRDELNALLLERIKLLTGRTRAGPWPSWKLVASPDPTYPDAGLLASMAPADERELAALQRACEVFLGYQPVIDTWPCIDVRALQGLSPGCYGVVYWGELDELAHRVHSP